MKAFAVFSAIITLIVLVAALPSFANAGPSVGVKEGDWIEYSISMTGPPLDQLRNLTWYRMEILRIDGALIEVNKTSRSVNGTFSSSLWDFDLTGGQTYGWVIIPPNLSQGESFFDSSKGINVMIEGEQRKTLLGASRDITHATDPPRVYKEWDKSTGVYVYSIDETADYMVVMSAIATNLWSQETSEQNQTAVTYLVAVTIVSLVVAVLIVLFYGWQKRQKKRR
jgi:hypothetical protein